MDEKKSYAVYYLTIDKLEKIGGLSDLGAKHGYIIETSPAQHEIFVPSANAKAFEERYLEKIGKPIFKD